MRARHRAATLVASIAIGGATLLGAPSTALAEDGAKATSLAAAAANRAQQGERRVAIDLYEEAYAAAPRKEYLRQIGVLYDALAYGGDSRDVRLAILYLERFLVDEAPSPERATIEQRLARLRTWKASMRSEPQPLPPGPSPLHLLAYNSEEQYDVAVSGQACTTPCTLLLPPGLSELKARGAGPIELHLVVPPRPGQIRLQHVDSRMFVAGAIMLPVGIVVGAGMWAIGLACKNDDGGCLIANFTVWPVLGFSTMVTGIVLLARGRVSPQPDANRVDIIARAPSVRLTGFGLAPQRGGATSGLALEF